MPPPERMTLKTNLSLHRSSCHHHPTSLHRSMTLTTRRRLQKEHLLPLPSRTTSTRLEDLFSSTDSRGACAASPVRPPAPTLSRARGFRVGARPPPSWMRRWGRGALGTLSVSKGMHGFLRRSLPTNTSPLCFRGAAPPRFRGREAVARRV